MNVYAASVALLWSTALRGAGAVPPARSAGAPGARPAAPVAVPRARYRPRRPLRE